MISIDISPQAILSVCSVEGSGLAATPIDRYSLVIPSVGYRGRPKCEDYEFSVNHRSCRLLSNLSGDWNEAREPKNGSSNYISQLSLETLEIRET